jgi:hypothetical protein
MVSAQVEQKPQGGRPESGDSLAAKDLGVPRDEVRRAKQIASIAPEAKRVAERFGLDDNQSALLAAAREPSPQAQVAVLESVAERGRVASTPSAPPLRNLLGISGGELARWIKITTPNDRPHVIRVLEMTASILRDEMGAAALRPPVSVNSENS